MTHVFQSQIKPNKGLFEVDGQNTRQVQTPTTSWRLIWLRIGEWLGGWGNLRHPIKLTHRVICEFDLDQKAKGCDAAFWIQSNQ
jgi:hypothetical protein